jgi:hypothetical protein
MSASNDPLLSLPSSIARGVGLAGVVLIVLFLTILSTSLLPVSLLDAALQLRVGGALINASPFPLIGLVLLHIAASLDPQDPLLLNVVASPPSWRWPWRSAICSWPRC